MPFTDPILAGETLVRTAMQSDNYAAGVAGWRLTRDGDAFLNSVAARGSVIVGPDTGFGQIRIEVLSNQGVIGLKPGGATVATNGMIYAEEISIGPGIPPNVLHTVFAGTTDGADVSLQFRKVVAGASSATITADTTTVSGTLTATGKLAANGRPVLVNAAVIPYQATPSLTTSSATFATMVGVGTVSITKQYAAAQTYLRASISTSAFSSLAAHPIEYAINITDGAAVNTDFACAGFYFNDAAKHLPISGIAKLNALAAGTYTVSIKWRSPDATQMNTDANDRMSVTIDEIPV